MKNQETQKKKCKMFMCILKTAGIFKALADLRKDSWVPPSEVSRHILTLFPWESRVRQGAAHQPASQHLSHVPAGLQIPKEQLVHRQGHQPSNLWLEPHQEEDTGGQEEGGTGASSDMFCLA